MTHFSSFDTKTFEFLLKLKATNEYWFITLLKCAEKNPKLTQKCIDDICVYLKQFEFESKDVNPFQICNAVNRKVLTNANFQYLSQSAWRHYLAKTVQKYHDQHKL